MTKFNKTKESLRTWVEIDRSAIAYNYKLFRKLIGTKTKFLSVIKSNAYGHNILEFAPEMERLGVDWLGVDALGEALSVRRVGVKIPMLVLGYTLPNLYLEARKEKVSVTISSFAQLGEALKLSSSKTPLKVHIKVDTGMHRQGFQLHEGAQLIELLTRVKKNVVIIEGLFTHFAEAKNPQAGDNTRRQISEFKEWQKIFNDAGLHPICHAAATGGTLLYKDAHFDMVRVGIGGYGLWPSREVEQFLGKQIKLKPILSWKAIVSEVKEVKKGERVGYDFTERLIRDSKIAVIPVGYWHGIPRTASGRARVLLHGKTARILGRVSMDMIVVDVTDIPKVKMGDIVTLIGKDGKEEITAGELAQFAGTTHYEIVTRLNPLMKKFYS